MFSFVEVQESIPNINGIENFNKLFKKSHSSLTDSWSMSVCNVWVLPGHIIVSLDEGHKLLSFDLLPKPKPWPDVIDFLNTKPVTKKKGQKLSVFEVFSIGINPLFLFAVMKTTEVHVWKFTRSAYEWSFISKFNLSAGKNAQIISVCLDAKSKVMFWCERRTTTQCCVCKCELNVNQKDIFGKGADILQNCPPVQIFLAGSSSVLLRPTANSPIGLTMFWSAACGRIQLHVWKPHSSGILPLSASTDFQSLVTDSISLWINNSPTDPAAVAYCAHSVTQELYILESTYALYGVKTDEEGRPIFRKICMLDGSHLVELNQRKTYRICVFQKFLGLLLDDDEFIVFEIYKGMVVWSTDSLKHERPRIWTSQGAIPRVGVWSASAVRMLRSDSVLKQATNMLKFDARVEKPALPRERRVSKEYTLQMTLNIDKDKKQTGNMETYIVVDQEDDDKRKGMVHSDDGSDKYQESHANPDSLLLVSEYLRDWNSRNYSSEISHWLLTSPKLDINGKWLQISNEEELRRIYGIFGNPCLLLALFYENPKYRQFLDRIMKDHVIQHENEAIDDIEPELLSLMKQYCTIAEEKNSILNVDSQVENDSPATSKTWHGTFESLLRNETMAKQDLYEILQWASETKQSEFISGILDIFGIKETEPTRTTNNSESLQVHLSKAILRSDTGTFELVCNGLWETYPESILELLRRVSDVAKTLEVQGFLRSPALSSSATKSDIIRRAINTLEVHSHNGALKKEQLKTLANLHLSGEAEDILRAANIYLENEAYNEAITLLESQSDNCTIHYKIFYAIFTTLIQKKRISDHAQRLSQYIPPNFRLAEFCHAMKGLENHNEACEVFVSGDRETSFGDLESLFIEMLRERDDQLDM